MYSEFTENPRKVFVSCWYKVMERLRLAVLLAERPVAAHQGHKFSCTAQDVVVMRDWFVGLFSDDYQLRRLLTVQWHGDVLCCVLWTVNDVEGYDRGLFEESAQEGQTSLHPFFPRQTRPGGERVVSRYKLSGPIVLYMFMFLSVCLCRQYHCLSVSVGSTIVSVSVGSTIVCRLYKLPIPEQAQFALQLTDSLYDFV